MSDHEMFDAVINHAREDMAASPAMWQEQSVQEGGAFGAVLGDAAKGLWQEAVLPALEKMIPQGAAELSQALFAGNSYVPYGATERPVPMEQDAGSIYGSPQTAQEIEAAPAAPQVESQLSYDDLKQQVAAQPAPSMEQEMERD